MSFTLPYPYGPTGQSPPQPSYSPSSSLSPSSSYSPSPQSHPQPEYTPYFYPPIETQLNTIINWTWWLHYRLIELRQQMDYAMYTLVPESVEWYAANEYLAAEFAALDQAVEMHQYWLGFLQQVRMQQEMEMEMEEEKERVKREDCAQRRYTARLGELNWKTGEAAREGREIRRRRGKMLDG